jgi:uncharacterized delta-60 repeat protein
MRYRLTIRVLGILLIGLGVFLPTANAAPGDLDLTFDGDGKLTTALPGSGCHAAAVAIQPDGKIVAAGQTRNNSNTDFALVRYNQNGSLDTTFDGDGIVTTDFLSSGNYLDTVNALVIQPDGKIIAAGYTEAGGPIGFALARYNSDGSLDTTFDGDGKVITYFSQIGLSSSFAYDVALQPDGKIIAAGSMFPNGSTEDFALARYNANGSLDTTFDGDGKLTTPVGSFNDRAQAVAIQTDGKIVAAGYTYQGSSDHEYALTRYNPDGSLDTSFDDDGKLRTLFSNFSDAANAVSIQADGKIVAIGESVTATGKAFSMARYNPNGSLDTAFDGDGKVLTTVINGSNNIAKAVAIQTDGKIITAGYSGSSSGPDDFTLIRYNGDGSLDNSYGIGGIVKFKFVVWDRLQAIALDPLGRAVVAGGTSMGGAEPGTFAVARILGDLSPSANVSIEGRVLRANGRGIFNGFITITDSAGNTRTARTNPFGYYRLYNVPVGTAVISISSKRFTFANPTQTINLTDNLRNFDFTAIE